MEWVASNWVWILLGIGLVWFMFRGHGGMGCCGGGGHSHGGHGETPEHKGEQKPMPTKGSCH
ncbi:MAG: DUF2933 domain-containing protein [Candidatus Methylomirabilales bacterium]